MKTKTGLRCPECRHRPGQFDRAEGTCSAQHPTKVNELCEHRCTEWVEDKPAVDRSTRHVGRRHPETAQAMQAKILPRIGSVKRDVYNAVRHTKATGATDDELEQALAKSHQTVSGARNLLMNDGWVIDSGKRRPTRYGNDAIVWVAVTEDGLRVDTGERVAQ